MNEWSKQQVMAIQPSSHSNAAQVCEKSIPNSSQTHQVGDQYPATRCPKSIKIGPRILLGGSWGHVGHKRLQSTSSGPKRESSPPTTGSSPRPTWGSKSVKIGRKSDPKCNRFLIDLEIYFENDLVDGAKLALKSVQVC